MRRSPNGKHHRTRAASKTKDNPAKTAATTPEDRLSALIAALDVPAHLERRARELLAPLADRSDYMKGTEVDKMLRCSRRKRLRLVNAGFLPEVRPGGGHAVYLRIDVGRLLMRSVR